MVVDEGDAIEAIRKDMYVVIDLCVGKCQPNSI